MSEKSKNLLWDFVRMAFRLSIACSPLLMLLATFPQVILGSQGEVHTGGTADAIRAGESIFKTVINSGALGILAFFYVVEIGVREWNRYQDRVAARERGKIMAAREKEYREATGDLLTTLQSFVDVVAQSNPAVVEEIQRRRANGERTRRIDIQVR